MFTYLRGLLRCSFLARWAMREPQTAGRVTGTDSRAFLYIPENHNRNNPILGNIADANQRMVKVSLVLSWVLIPLIFAPKTE